MRKNSYYELTDLEEIRRLIRENPWATLVSNPSTGLVASHYPILLEEDREDISIVTHVGRPDETVHELGEHELLVIVQGPHGYISSSWYGDHIEVPTWNFIAAHLSGVPEILEPDENFEVLTRLVDHFERHVDEPAPPRRHSGGCGRCQQGQPGHDGTAPGPYEDRRKRKMSQNKSPEIVETVLGELEGDGPYASAELAREMRLVHDAGREPE